MPRGAIAKRSKSPGIAGPPGPAGLGPFAFQSIAVMAAFPAGALVDGVEAHVFTLDEVWGYDPSSTLVPDVSAYAPLGITIVAANGPGNWTRREETSRRWRNRAAWFIDPVGGDDEASGATAPTALGTMAEFLRRVQGLPIGVPGGFGFDVTIMSDLAEVVVIDTRHFSGNDALYIHGAPVVLFSSAITAHVDYSDAAQTIGTITIAGLPVSFTASGLVGKLARIPGTGVEFWIMEDMGAKTARISPPQAAPFASAPGVVTNVVVEIYRLVKFATELTVLSEGGESEQVDFETLELGTTNGPHVVEFKSAPALVESCRVNGLDQYAGSEVTWYNCSFYEFRAQGASHPTIANGYTGPDGGSFQTRVGATCEFTRFTSYKTMICARAIIQNADGGWWAFIDNGSGIVNAFQVEPGGFIDVSRGAGAPARLFTVGQGAGDVGAFIFAMARIVYDVNKPPLFTAPAIQIQLGNTTKLLSQLPYTNPIDGAAFVATNAPDPTEDYFIPQTVDQTVSGATADLISQVIAVNGLRDVQFWVSFNIQTALNAVGYMFLEIDGAAVCKGTIQNVAAGYHFGALHWKASLAAGNHTIKVRMQSVANNMYSRPVVAAGDEFSNLMIKELYG